MDSHWLVMVVIVSYLDCFPRTIFIIMGVFIVVVVVVYLGVVVTHHLCQLFQQIHFGFRVVVVVAVMYAIGGAVVRVRELYGCCGCGCRIDHTFIIVVVIELDFILIRVVGLVRMKNCCWCCW